jgi:hypothetical protein
VTTTHTRTAIAGATWLTFGLAVAAAIGVVPRATGSGEGVARLAAGPLSHAVRATSSHDAAAFMTRHALRVRPHALRGTARHAAVSPANVRGVTARTLIAALTVQPVAASSTPSGSTNITQAHHKKRHHHKRRHHHPKPAAPTVAPRTHPSSAAVSNAISGLRQYVNSPFTPTASQVATFGNDVCTAFDQNHTYAYVVNEVEQKVHQIPFTSLKPGGADYVVKTAVALYCPGYASKVG